MSGLKKVRRCGARTRAGTSCRAPAVTGGTRCRMHGGRHSGAPPGNTNARTHGAFTAAERARRRFLRLEIERMEAFLRGVAHRLRRPIRSRPDTQVRYRYTVHGVVFRNKESHSLTTLPVSPVIPAQAGIQKSKPKPLDSRLRGNDAAEASKRPKSCVPPTQSPYEICGCRNRVHSRQNGPSTSCLRAGRRVESKK